MPLPNAPTHHPDNPDARLATQKTNHLLLILGLLCAFLGLGALLLPTLITIPEMQDFLVTASWVGWVMLALGGAFIGLYARRCLMVSGTF